MKYELIRSLNETKDEVVEAVEQVNERLATHPCNKYFDPSRLNEFAEEIAKLMKKEKVSYEEAKAKVFDETEVPPAGSKCCKDIHAEVVYYLMGDKKT